jgi:uncharacterized membrane protein YgdD (TMEM256/DUF423 family)
MALGIGAGAFGAHALEKVVEPRMLEVWKTAVLYHLIHGVVLYFLAATGRVGAAWKTMAAGLFIFSGTLYALVLSGVKVLGAVTPIGGTLLILSWAMLAWRNER